MHVQEVRCLKYVSCFVGAMWMLSCRSVPTLNRKEVLADFGFGGGTCEVSDLTPTLLVPTLLEQMRELSEQQLFLLCNATEEGQSQTFPQH